jgi:uncharacterized delta-60 repeat protein
MKLRYILLVLLFGCAKETVNTHGKNPYSDPVQPAILINKDGINPNRGAVNDEVVITGKGFEKNKAQLAILFNGQPATVLDLTDTTVRVRIPPLASTGNVNAQVGQEYFFGPFFRVLGTFEMDTVYPSARGADNNIYDIVPVESNKYLIVGDFNNYDNANIDGGINKVARINHDGTLDRSFTYGNKTGTNTGVYTAATLPDNNYLVAGGFSTYQGVSFVNSVAKLFNNGTLQTNKIITPSGVEQTVSALKGGVSGQVYVTQVQGDGKLLLTGSFRYYVQPDFNLVSSRGLDSVHLDSILVNNLVRLNTDGGIDSTFNYDLVSHRGNVGANGAIAQMQLMPDGKILLAGNFTSFNGQPVPHIVRLNTDGTIDGSFNPGAGADLAINNFTRQPDGKFILVGAFNNYDGQRVAHIVRIGADGAYDPSFHVNKGANGYIYYAGIMPGGEIILSGTFDQFEDLRRNNMIVLNSDGSVHPTYNTNGGITLGEHAVSGGVTRIVQQPGERAMLMTGFFTKYDYRNSNRIVRVTY